MKSTALCIDKPDLPARQGSLFSRAARRLLLTRLRDLRRGQLVLIDGNHRYVFGTPDAVFQKPVTITVWNDAFYYKVLVQDALGAGEAYMDGYWECDDLSRLIELLLYNGLHQRKIGSGMPWLVKPLHILQRYLNRNSLKGSRRNIGAHYDLGNDLFELFLDETMMYSCGIFQHGETSLRQASEAKLALICRKLQLKPSDHVLEIGTGWGGFALYAAQNFGCKVTTTTISRQQYDYTAQRIREAGLEDRITLLFRDYRELDGSFDKLVSIEMIEAVGHEHFDTYFRKCSQLLQADGIMLLQAITIADQRYAIAKRTVDFIQRYIFPGGCLPSVAALSDSIARKTDMRIYHLEDIGTHYATTLQHWRERFFARLDDVRQLGYPERFIRMWNYYLSYCEGGFRQQSIGTVQLLLTKPRSLREPLTCPEY